MRTVFVLNYVARKSKKRLIEQVQVQTDGLLDLTWVDACVDEGEQVKDGTDNVRLHREKCRRAEGRGSLDENEEDEFRTPGGQEKGDDDDKHLDDLHQNEVKFCSKRT